MFKSLDGKPLGCVWLREESERREIGESMRREK